MLDGTTVILAFEGRLPDGKVYDKMTKDNPLKFEVGRDLVLEGFEREVREMEKGEKKTFTIKDWEAFGEYNEELVTEIPMELMPNVKGLERDKVIWIINDEGNKAFAIKGAKLSATIVFDEANSAKPIGISLTGSTSKGGDSDAMGIFEIGE